MKKQISKHIDHRSQMHNTAVNGLSVAYFSMEIGIDTRIPNYAGGLGILAGDTLKAALDLGIDMVGVTLLYRNGYFKQHIDTLGNQTESPDTWDISTLLTKEKATATIRIAGEDVTIAIWKYTLSSEHTAHTIPIYFLDTDVAANSPHVRTLCASLYPQKDQFLQEMVLGIGGVSALYALGYETFDNYHLNETHAAPVILELIERRIRKEHLIDTSKTQIECTHCARKDIQKRLCFTTHTPLAGGHERYTQQYLTYCLGQEKINLIPPNLWQINADGENELNMALLCLEFSKYSNGVAIKHQHVSQQMYPQYTIKAVTNGIHSQTWASPHHAKLFDEYTPGWRTWAFDLRQALSIPDDKLLGAHNQAKQDLADSINMLEELCEMPYNPLQFTIGFARRAAQYKRHNFIFSDLAKLEAIAEKHGGLQFVFAGKAYPSDEQGKDIIRQIYGINQKTSHNIKLFYIPNYNIVSGGLITAGVDIWLNNPTPPLEASGTSGMKASLNGVPNFSILDGWWIEGCIEGITGWAIGELCEGDYCTPLQLADLYHKLDTVILPLYKDKKLWAQIMKQSIAINGSYFNTHRMLVEYITEAYIR